MPKTIAVLGSALFFVVAPLVLTGFVPWWITHWEFRPAFFGFELIRAIGLMLIIAGVPGVVDSFARFALQGLGTPAPIAPTQKLVVTGLYRYVRNPIYVGVAAVIFGQALLFGDWRLLWYAALLWLFFHVFVLVYEEPTLKQTFGAFAEAGYNPIIAVGFAYAESVGKVAPEYLPDVSFAIIDDSSLCEPFEEGVEPAAERRLPGVRRGAGLVPGPSGRGPEVRGGPHWLRRRRPGAP